MCVNLTGSKLFTLKLVGHDEYTRKLLENREIFPQSSAQLAAARLAEALSSAKLPVRGALRKAALAAEAGLSNCLCSPHATCKLEHTLWISMLQMRGP